MRSHGGFTLVEIMVVVGIIGILAAIAIPQFIRFQARSKQSEAKTNLKAVFTGQRAKFSERERYSTRPGEVGFAPERGNRYLYDFGPAAGGFTTCGAGTAFEPRADGTIPPGGYTGIAADTLRYGSTVALANLNAGAASGASPVTWYASGASLTPITGSVVGFDITSCPQCDFSVCARGNVDADAASDEFFIGSQFASLTAADCAEGSAVGVREAPGAPINSKSDVSCSQP